MALFRSFYWLSNIPLFRCTTSSTILLSLDIYVASCCYCCLVIKSCPSVCDHQAPLSMAFCRHEYCSGSPFPSPGDLPNPGIEPMSPAWQADSLWMSHLGSPANQTYFNFFKKKRHQSACPFSVSCKDIVRRWLSTSHGESSHQNLTMLAPWA